MEGYSQLQGCFLTKEVALSLHTQSLSHFFPSLSVDWKRSGSKPASTMKKRTIPKGIPETHD